MLFQLLTMSFRRTALLRNRLAALCVVINSPRGQSIKRNFENIWVLKNRQSYRSPRWK